MVASHLVFAVKVWACGLGARLRLRRPPRRSRHRREFHTSHRAVVGFAFFSYLALTVCDRDHWAAASVQDTPGIPGIAARGGARRGRVVHSTCKKGAASATPVGREPAARRPYGRRRWPKTTRMRTRPPYERTGPTLQCGGAPAERTRGPATSLQPPRRRAAVRHAGFPGISRERLGGAGRCRSCRTTALRLGPGACHCARQRHVPLVAYCSVAPPGMAK